jgi:hypothetical protein
MPKMPTPDPKPTRGGARKGAGRPATVTGPDVRAVTLRMSEADVATFKLAGDGIVSLGVQRAAQLLRERK